MTTAYVAPRGETEEAIAEMWQALLGIERVGVDDNFFDLGGQSLLALQLLSRMRERFGVELSVHTIFNAPTVAQLAELVREAGDTADPERIEQLLSMVEGLSEDELKDLLAEQGN
jgi:acyl carrier protein